MSRDPFTEFEHQGWQRVAGKYEATWARSTRQFIQPLLDAAQVCEGMTLLDLGCGPGYVSAAASERGATATGVDFSSAMIAIAREKFPRIEFREGDAQKLPFSDGIFDRAVANFALLHLSDPERAFTEAYRVLKRGGRFAFTTWAAKEENVFARLIEDAVCAHANLDTDLPKGPPKHLFDGREQFRAALSRAGFDGASMTFNLHTIRWHVPSADFVFKAEREAGVRTAGVLARQTPETLQAIKASIEAGMRPYAEQNGFAIPTTAYVVSIARR